MVEFLGPLENKLNSDLPGLGEPQLIPLDQGAITVTARDATNCFDVNRLTSGTEGGVLVADPDMQDAYRALLTEAIEDGYASDIVALVSALTDWMDDNSVPGSGGAEDGYYMSEVPSYRTSGQKLGSLTELRSIKGYTPAQRHQGCSISTHWKSDTRRSCKWRLQAFCRSMMREN